MICFSGWGRFLVAMSALLLGGLASAGVPATLVNSQLRSEPVVITSLREDVLVYFDAQRRLCESPIDHFVQIRDMGEATEPPIDSAVVELVDGQRLIGRWISASAGSFQWEHEIFGRVRIPLDDIAAITVAGDPIAPPGVGQDIVRLVNQDHIRGVVTGVEPEGLTMMLPGANEAMVLPSDRIEALWLANAVVKPRSELNRIVLADGSRLLARHVDIADVDARVDVVLPGRPVQTVVLPIETLMRIDFTANGVRLLDLAAQSMAVTAGGAVFGLPMPPRIEAGDIYLHAPVTVSFVIPKTADRFVATAELASSPEVASKLHEWADFEVVVRHGPGGLDSRFRVNGRLPRVQINVPVASMTQLIIEVNPAINGPILDRLRLRDAVLLDHSVDDQDLSKVDDW